MVRQLRLLLTMLVAVFAVATVAVAEAPAPKPSPFGTPIPSQTAPQDNAGYPAQRDAANRSLQPSAWQQFRTKVWSSILTIQNRFNRDMAASVRKLKGDSPLTAALALIMFAFGYGVLHAAGPGHGKAVISAYVLASKETVRRGVALSFLSALFQAVSAVVFVGVLALILNQTSIQMRATEATIETLSWGLVTVIGAVLIWRQIRAWFSRAAAHDGATADNDGHSHTHSHDHGADGSSDCDCGHAHMPPVSAVQGPWSWRAALPVALSIGIRPCTGAILLLIFALSQGMLWAGIIGTFAMSIGTALTVSAFAVLAAGSRDFAAKQAGAWQSWTLTLQRSIGLLGAIMVFTIGLLFFLASLGGPAPF